MRGGYLLIETRSGHEGLVRIRGSDQAPSPSPDGHPDPERSRLRYAAWFANLDVALMHAHTALRRALVDADSGIYRTDPTRAVAAVDAIDLRHRPVYLDPALETDPGLSHEIERRRRRHRRIDRLFNGIGIAALLILLFLLGL